MLAIQTPENLNRGYGLGLSLISDDEGNWFAGHGGSVAGYNAYMTVDPNAKIGVVLLRNYTEGRTNLGGMAQSLLSELRASSR